MNPRHNTKYIFKKRSLGWIIVLLAITGCKAPDTTSDRQSFQDLQEVVNNREFTIKFQWAQPQRGGMIDLVSNPNEITMSGDQVAIQLPYFGVRHRGGAYTPGKGGISYDGQISNLVITDDPAKRNITMKFDANQDSESLVFTITFYDNGKAYASVFSSDRESIVYQSGNVTPTSRLSKE